MSGSRSGMIDIPAVESAINQGCSQSLLQRVNDSPSSIICSWTGPLLRVSVASSWQLHHHLCGGDEIRLIERTEERN